MSQNRTMTFRVYDRHDGQHTTRCISIQSRVRRDIGDVIERCRENEIGYETQDAADSMRARMELLQEQGNTVHYDPDFNEDETYIRLEYLLYERDGETRFCTPEIHVGRRLHVMERSLKFLRKLGRNVERRKARAQGRRFQSPVSQSTYADPDAMLGALRAMRSMVEVEAVELHPYWHFYVPTKGATKAREVA